MKWPKPHCLQVYSWHVANGCPGFMVTTHLIFCGFFLVAFLVAVRYRKMVSYITGLLTAVSYSFLLWQKMAFHAPFVTSHALLEPFLLLICSVVVSDLLSVQRRQFTEASEQHRQINEKLAETQQNYQTALKINTELERQIAGQTLSITTISDQVAHIWKLEGRQRYKAIVHLIAQALEAPSCALYRQVEGQMRLYAQIGQETEYAHTLKLTNPLVGRVISTRQVSTVRDVLAEEKTLTQDIPTMAGPLLDSNGQITGMVVIESLPFLKFTPQTIRLLSSILQMISLLEKDGGRHDSQYHLFADTGEADATFHLEKVL